MAITIYILLALVAAFVAINIAWRWASRRWALPCPSIMSGAVDGTLADRFAGTEETLERLELQPGMTIVEIGPGPGRLLIPAARRILPGGRAIGVELQEKMLDKLRRKLAKDDPGNLVLIHADATKPVLPPASVDLIYLCTVLGEIPDRRRALENCFAALRPSGRLVIVEIIGDPHYQTRGRVRELAESVGFTFEKLTGNWRRSTSSFTKRV